MTNEHFIEIAATEKRSMRAYTRTYRFYGLGRWEVESQGTWQPINAIYVPGRVLEVAAAHCSHN